MQKIACVGNNGKAIWLSVLFIAFFFAPSASFSRERSIRVVVNSPSGKTLTVYKKSHALVVGNGDYSLGWDPLPGALADVKDVAAVLDQHGFDVTLKTNLTKEQFSRVIAEFVLKNGREKDSRLLFYYAGHGHTSTMATGEELGYLVMVDAPNPEHDFLGFSMASVDMNSIITQAKLIQSKHVLFLFDSCFSGSLLNMRDRIVPHHISDKIRHPVRQFITAGRANESVPDQSVFKVALLNLLEGRAREPIPDGYITGEELGLYLKNKIPEYSDVQHPQYGKIRDPRLDQGDFVFLYPDTSEQTLAIPLDSPETSLQPDVSQKEPQQVIEPIQQPAEDTDVIRCLRMLKSNNPVEKIKGAKMVCRSYFHENPEILEVVKFELLKGYKSHMPNRRHVDAMAWLCNILGESGNKSYKSTLDIVSSKSPNKKLKKYAMKNYRKLEPGTKKPKSFFDSLKEAMGKNKKIID